VPNALPRLADGVSLLAMYSLARLLQILGLVIPPCAIIAELSQSISTGQMLGFLVVSVCVFSIGNLLQRYSGGNES
jgi:hypothetical protein